MTRINVVNPSELSGPHLVAEYRELPRVFSLARKAQHELHKKKIPQEYTLGTGHEVFFRDKLLYLAKRYERIHKECIKRGFNVHDYTFYKEQLPPLMADRLWRDWTPNKQAIDENVKRLYERFFFKKECLPL